MTRQTTAFAPAAIAVIVALTGSALAADRQAGPGRGAALPPIKVKIIGTTSGGQTGNLSEAEACAEPGWKIIGGGASVRFEGPGGLLTASYPEGNCWRAVSKAHEQPDKQSVEAIAVVLYDPNNEWDVVVEQATGGVAAHPSAQVRVRDGYVMTGGGARVNWTGAGNLLTASFPATNGVWEARAKDHRVSDPAAITVYAIGLRAKNGAVPKSTLVSAQSSSKPHAGKQVFLSEGWTLSGGGARVNWNGAGNLLFKSAPDGSEVWSGLSKDHIDPSPASITVFAIGIRP